ncbi:MAG: hypothetical protein JSU74_02325 [Candidatus Zixiibacteriota bacterium]|nr:MAG: hypothetical protein JSU74_02325 [candidate division Zixibacteria bacterium]
MAGSKTDPPYRSNVSSAGADEDICRPRNQNAQVDILDVDDFIDWLFRSGAAPGCLDEADVDGNDQPDILDADYLVEWLFRGGPAPVACP